MGIYQDNQSVIIYYHTTYIIIAQNSFDSSITDIAFIIYFVIVDELFL